MTLRGAFLALAVLALAASPARAADAGPFDLEAFFRGDSVSAGTVTTFGLWSAPFTAGFRGTDQGGGLRLVERFRFADGTPVQRWHIRQDGMRLSGWVETGLGDGSMAPAVPIAGERTAAGATIRYRGYAPGGGRRLLDFRHELRPAVDGTVGSQVTVRWGVLPVARATVRFAKSPAALAGAAAIGAAPHRR